MNRKIISLCQMLMMVLLVVCAIGFSATTSNAQEPVVATPKTYFGSVGLARGQVARLNVTNLRRGTLDNDDQDHDPPGIPCAFGFQFLDARGNTIARTVERVFPGNTNSFDLSFPDAAPKGTVGRVQIRAIIWSLMNAEDTRRCVAISTLEIIDLETRRTTVLYPEPPR